MMTARQGTLSEAVTGNLTELEGESNCHEQEMLHSKNCPQGELENVLKAKLIYCLKIELQNDYKVTNYWLSTG